MSQSKKFRRDAKRRDREQSARVPVTGGEEADALRKRLDGVAKQIGQGLPGRPFVLLSAPVGTRIARMDHVATVTNMPREQAARLFAGMLDFWRPSGIVVQPDQDMVSALREGVHLLRDVTIPEIAKSIRNGLDLLAQLLEADTQDPEALRTFALGVALDAMAVLDRVTPATSRQPEGIPVPMPPPDGIRSSAPPREWPKGDTKTTLVADLREKPPSETRDRLIAEALAGRFHDYDSDEVCGKVVANAELLAAGFDDLARKVVDGAYDDERPTVEQEEEMRQQLGPGMFDAIMSGKPRTVQ
jgi:hypothetical protein